MQKTIAWIEDDLDVLSSLIDYLSDDGFLFKEYRTYREALDNIEEIRECDLILLDLILPPGLPNRQGNFLGLDLLRRLRDEFHVTIPIIALSVIVNSHAINVDELENLNAIPLPKFSDLKDIREEILKAMNLPTS